MTDNSVSSFIKDLSSIDDRVCLFYVIDRVDGIWGLMQSDIEMGVKELDDFKRELIYNLGVNARLKQ